MPDATGLPQPDDDEHTGLYMIMVAIPVDMTACVDNSPHGAALRCLDFLRERAALDLADDAILRVVEVDATTYASAMS